eukprot:359101-Chlamydomonas_euryale.AAC.4
MLPSSPAAARSWLTLPSSRQGAEQSHFRRGERPRADLGRSDQDEPRHHRAGAPASRALPRVRTAPAREVHRRGRRVAACGAPTHAVAFGVARGARSHGVCEGGHKGVAATRWWLRGGGCALVAARWWLRGGCHTVVAARWWPIGGGRSVVATRWWQCGGGRSVVATRWWLRGGGRSVVATRWWLRGGFRAVVTTRARASGACTVVACGFCV